MDAVFCVPCLLFTNSTSRGGHQRHSQGNAFVVNGFSNWKKQTEWINLHERTQAHKDAQVAQALFLRKSNIESVMSNEQVAAESRRLKEE